MKSPLPLKSLRSWSFPSPQARGPLIAAWLFPLFAWAAATLYFGGALGKNCDDYSINMRDVVTGAIPAHFNPWAHFPYFIRPLHHALLFGGMTLFPAADRPMHIAIAIWHAIACIGIWQVMRVFTTTRLAPAAAVLIFLVLPWHGEAVFWYSTISTSIGVAIFCWCTLLAMRFMRIDHICLTSLAGVFILAFLVPCFYEQSIAPAAALPLLCFAAAPATIGWRTRVARAITATAAASIGAACYVLLLITTAPKSARGGAMSFVTRDRLYTKYDEVYRGVKYNLIGERANDILRGSVKLGSEVVESPRGMIVGGFLLAAAVLWMVWAIRKGGAPEKASIDAPAPPQRFHAAWLIPIGIIIFIAGFIPIYVIDRQIVELRNLYVPLVGATLVLGGLFDVMLSLAVGRPLSISHSLRATIAAATIAAVGLGATGLIGFQKLYRNRSERDLREMAQLKELIPNPPPGTVFAPFRTRSRGADTNYRLFDRERHGVFETPWSAPALLLRAYHRADIGVTSSNPWGALPLDKPDANSIHWGSAFGFDLIKDPVGGVRIPWDSIVPFVTDARPEARVRLISEITIETPDHRDLVIHPKLVQQVLVAHPDTPTAYYHLVSGDAAHRADLIPLKFWEFADNSPVQFTPMWIWAGNDDGGGGKPRDCAWLAAYYQKFASMSISMPPLDRPERLLMRATIAEYDLDQHKHEFAYVEELVVTMADAPTQELAVLRLDPREFKRTRRWAPIIATLPPRPQPAGGRIVVTIRHAKEPPVRLTLADTTPAPASAQPAVLPIWVTPGYEEAIPLQPAEARQTPAAPALR